MLDIRPAGPEDLGAIKVLLAVCLLPSHDESDGRSTFFVAESERGIIGVCGFERCDGSVALLCSLGVMPGYRKQRIGRRLIHRAMSHAQDQGIDRLFVLTESATDYFQNSGFTALEKKSAPSELKSSPLLAGRAPSSALLLVRALRPDLGTPRTPAEPEVVTSAKAHFDSGYHCAESVLLAAAEDAGIQSPLIPAIATGFCHGTSATWGTCGALNGAILAVNIALGRSSPEQSTADNYKAVRKLIAEFDRACGSTLCRELMGCDLDTRDGLRTYQNNHQRVQCREFVGIAASLAAQLIESHHDQTRKQQAASIAA